MHNKEENEKSGPEMIGRIKRVVLLTVTVLSVDHCSNEQLL